MDRDLRKNRLTYLTKWDDRRERKAIIVETLVNVKNNSIRMQAIVKLASVFHTLKQVSKVYKNKRELVKRTAQVRWSAYMMIILMKNNLKMLYGKKSVQEERNQMRIVK